MKIIYFLLKKELFEQLEFLGFWIEKIINGHFGKDEDHNLNLL